VEGKTVDYTTMTSFDGTVESGSASIDKYDGQNALKIGLNAKVRIIEGFEVDSLAKYTVTFWAKAAKQASYSIVFSGYQPVEINKTKGDTAAVKYILKASEKWTKVVFEIQSKPGVTDGYFRIENTRTTPIYIQKVQVGYYPDNHRQQTAEERMDTIYHAINSWSDGIMKINLGRITSFDLIDEAIDVKSKLENGKYDLKHSNEKIFWQDELGSENYVPIVSQAASAAFEKHQGDPAKLRFYISETGLEEQLKFESLQYWMSVWENNGAKIDGINAKLNLTFSEDPDKQADNVATLNSLLDNLASTGKFIRLSNFDIKYQDAKGSSVSAKDITPEQRQLLADYYGYVITSYMNKIPHEKQGGICKGNIVDTSDPVGLWSNSSIDNRNTKDWVRTATYEAFCKALSGEQ
jgi:hypothetical protein